MVIDTASKMADVHDHSLELQENMEYNVLNSCGIPLDILKMLGNTSAPTCGRPKWSLRITDSKIYLDLAWNKESHFPAKKHCESDNNNSKDTPAKQVLTKKRKSPSTRRRDQRRLKDWIARKRRISSDGLDQGTAVAMEGQGPTVHLDQPTPADPNPPQPQETVSQTSPSVIHDVPQDNVHHFVEVVNAVQHGPVDVAVDVHHELSESESSSDTDSEILPVDLPVLPVKPEEHYCFNITCFKSEIEVPGGLKKCTRCKFATYCSRECQAQHWKMHKAGCGKISSGEL